MIPFRTWVANLTLAAWCVADIVRWAPHLTLRDGLPSFLFLLSLLLSFAGMAFFALTRSAAAGVDTSPRTWLLVILSAATPQALDFLPPQPPHAASDYVRLISGLLLLASVATLRTRFAFLPANRGVVSAGPYRLIRHPMYLSYLLADGTAWLPVFDPLGALIWIAELVLFYFRARAEERLLGLNTAYAEFRHDVRFRFIPGLL